MDQEIKQLINSLVALGENKSELNFWLAVFEDLEPEEQDALISSLKDELKKLRSIHNS